MKPTLDLFPIGNCAVSAMVDREGRYVWSCLPRVDGDPVFCELLNGYGAGEGDAADDRAGFWAVEMEGRADITQRYLQNTPVLETIMTGKDGAKLRVLDFAPRHRQSGRTYRPMAFVRLIQPLEGAPRIRIRLRPAQDWGSQRAERTIGSNHLRYLGAAVNLRLTTNAAVSHVAEERLFRLEEEVALFLGPDEPFSGDVLRVSGDMLRDTCAYWREWVRTLATPLDYQSAVIRAAITLKLCMYEETGAIVAALTTSIPEAPGSGRNWDYRHCWLRDAYYVVRALNRLGAVDLLENYLGYLRNLVDAADGGHMQPVYGVGFEPRLAERTVGSLSGYRGEQPVRAGNQAYEHLQHDVYGQVILSNVQAFFDERLLRRPTVADLEALERVGERAFSLHDQPDAGLWEFRTRARVHTYSALLCWAGCDRLANAVEAMKGPAEAAVWRERAAIIRERIAKAAWDSERGRFAASFGGHELDASLLQMLDLGFVAPDDARNLATLQAIEADLRRGDYLLRYSEADDYGEPETAFNFCTFWFIEALHLTGRTEEARALFERMLEHRTAAGLLSEDISFADGELWGNYPQTYSLVGIINCAVLLSRPWSAVR